MYEKFIMPLKKWVYYLSKFTLIDEVLGFIYWAFAIYSMFIITGYIKTQAIMMFALFIYIFVVSIFYIFILKRFKRYWKGEPK